MWRAEAGLQLAFLDPERLLVATGTAEVVAGKAGQLGALLAEGGALQLLLSGHLLRATTLPWSDALTTSENRDTFIAARWRQVFGDTTDWTALMEPGPFEGSGILLGLPRSLAQSLRDCRASRLLVQPLASAAHAFYARTLPASCLFAVLEPGCLVLAVVRDRQIRRLNRYRIGPDWRQQLNVLRQRLLLQEPELELLGPIHVLALVPGGDGAPHDDGVVPLPWPAAGLGQALRRIAAGMRASSGFNLLPARSPRARGQRAALAAAAALLIVTLAGWLHTGHGDAEATPVIDVAPAAPPADSRARQALVREVAAVNQAVATLNLPADTILNTLAPGQLKDVALLGVELGNAGDGKIRVTASARDIGDMAAYLHLLEQRPRLHGVNLIHHELATDADWPYRFVLEAQWQP